MPHSGPGTGSDPLSLAHAVEATLDRLDVGVVVQAADGTISDGNDAAARLLGLTRDQLLGRDSFDPRWRAVGEDGEPMPGDRHPAMVALREGVEVHDSLLGVEVPEVGLRWLSVSAYPVRSDPGDPGSAVDGVIAVFRDVTDMTRGDAALRRWERRYRMAAELAPVGFAILSADGTVIRANEAFQRLFGRTEQQMQAGPWYAVLPVKDAGDQRPVASALRTGGQRNASVEVELETDPPRFLRVHAGVIDTPDSPTEIVAVAEDITEEVRQRHQLERRADHDPLTGLLHLRALLERATGDPASRRQAAMYVDVDRFKDINDTHGHDVGNAVLTDIGERLSAQVRSGDLVARVGGDEFVVLLQGVSEDSVALRVAERIVDVARVPIVTPAGAVATTVSVGLALAASGTAVEELLRRADRAMYAAKADGRDRLVVDDSG